MRGRSWLDRRSGGFSGICGCSLFLLVALASGCGSSMDGSVDLDAALQKSIAEGKGDPLSQAPTTPEQSKERGERLQKEAREGKKPKS